jgi:hypothetical protein
LNSVAAKKRIGEAESGKAEVSGNLVGATIPAVVEQLQRESRGANVAAWIDGMDLDRMSIEQTRMNEVQLKFYERSFGYRAFSS